MANNNVLSHHIRNGVGTNNSAGNADANNGVVGNVEVSSLRDICNFLQPVAINPSLDLPSAASSYDHLIEMIRGLDIQDDGIMMNHKMKAIRSDFCALVHDENMLCECMDYINDKALGDGDMALKFAMLFSSHNFDQLAMKDIKIRSAMLKVLEANYLNADTYRIHDKERLYNSITLLGEYYNRVRLADQSPITILGESLLSLLIREVSALEPIDVKLAKLILSQITLNGDIIRLKHKNELTQLLYHIRRNLIEQSTLSATVKALLLMTLDLYYSNFTNLGSQLEQMYTKYLVQDVEDEGNNNTNVCMPVQTLPVYMPVIQQMPQPLQVSQQPPSSILQPLSQQLTTQEPNKISPKVAATFENGDGENATNDSFESQTSTKKWSEQVCEDSLYESEFGNDFNPYEEELKSKNGCTVAIDSGMPDSLCNGRDKLNASGSNWYDDGNDSSSRNARRSQKPRSSPRPLKHQHRDGNDRGGKRDQQGEEYDDSKPLPRWRAPRFNRENNDHQSVDEQQSNHQPRYSAHFDDDQSVRSDGGSIRLYSINDRLRHSQEKIERSGNNYNSIANSNWDRQSQHADDRSERSYISNYERGNYKRGNHHYNNRHNYDKPPRFQKQQQKDNNIHSNSWRQSRNNAMNNSFHDDNSSYRSNGPESNSRSSSRARTLPRPGKSRHFEDDEDGTNTANTTSYRRSQSPSSHRQRHQQRTRNFNARYSSQSSLVSEKSSTFDRRQRNRNFGRHSQQQQDRWGEDTHSTGDQPDDNSWDAKKDNSELVRNARQTANYMNYLSSKK